MMTAVNTQAIQAINIQDFNFDGDSIGILVKDNQPFFSVPSICNSMGLDVESQRQLIERDAVLSSVACIIQGVARNGKKRELSCLPLEYLNGWLFKINPSRYTDYTKEKIIQYQKECYRVLHDHFFPASKELPPAKTKTDQLKQMLMEKRLQSGLVKVDLTMEKQADEMARRIYKGKGSLEDLALCPDLQAMTRAILDELNQGDMFKSSEADSQGSK